MKFIVILNTKSYLKIIHTKTSIKLPKFSGGTFEKITREIKTYTEEYHYKKSASKKTKDIYEEIRDRITNLGNNIDIIIRQKYIAFKTNYNFVYVNLKRSKVHVDISMKQKEMQDPKKIIRNMVGIGHSGAGKSRVTVSNKSQIPYLMGLIEQSYSKSIKS